MRFKGINNHHCTNQLIQIIITGSDFLVLWTLLPLVIRYIHHSHNWNDDSTRIFWLLCTISMGIAEYFFSSTIHERQVGAGSILRRSTMLVTTQTLLSYLMLRAVHFTFRLGWQLLFMGICMLFIIILLRFVARWILKYIRKKGYNLHRISFVGSDKEIQRLQEKIINNPSYGYKISSNYASADEFASMLDHPDDLVLGDELYLCVSRMNRELIERTANLCFHRMVKFYYVPIAEEKLNLQSVLIDDMEVMGTYSSPLEEPANRLIKRIVDVLLSIVFLIPTGLLLPFIVFMIKRQSPGPIFFRQERTGLDGRTFYCYKFRSMHVNNDADRLQATKDDPRKFPFGDFMRKTNIDELPQFWNTFIGDMSIVGPRPHMLAHTEQYNRLIEKYMVRHFVKPGITGWAQVTGFRGETRELWQMEGRVDRDIWYIQNWSIWLDLRIIWMTVKTIFKHDRNAY